MPTRRCTWAPVGKTPLIIEHWVRSKISVCGALVINPEGEPSGMFSEIRRSNYTQIGVVEFLEDLIEALPRKLTVILDNAKIHREEWIEDFVREHSNVVIEYFPAYAPELNPVEYVWSAIKRALANWAPDDIEQLERGVQRELQRAAFSPQLLRGCVAAAELEVSQS